MQLFLSANPKELVFVVRLAHLCQIVNYFSTVQKFLQILDYFCVDSSIPVASNRVPDNKRHSHLKFWFSFTRSAEF